VIARSSGVPARRCAADWAGDAFGLPAEKRPHSSEEFDPGDWTERQHRPDAGPSCSARPLRSNLGNREVATCHADYNRRWTSGLFLQFHEAACPNSAKKATVNLDPIDQTVLANEKQVIGSRSWRSVRQGEKRQAAPMVPAHLPTTSEACSMTSTTSNWPGPSGLRTDAGQTGSPPSGARLHFQIMAPLEPTTQPPLSIRSRSSPPALDTIYGVSTWCLASEHRWWPVSPP